MRVVGKAWDENGLSAVSRRKGLSARNAAKKAKRKKRREMPRGENPHSIQTETIPQQRTKIKK